MGSVFRSDVYSVSYSCIVYALAALLSGVLSESAGLWCMQGFECQFNVAIIYCIKGCNKN